MKSRTGSTSIKVLATVFYHSAWYFTQNHQWVEMARSVSPDTRVRTCAHVCALLCVQVSRVVEKRRSALLYFATKRKAAINGAGSLPALYDGVQRALKLDCAITLEVFDADFEEWAEPTDLSS